MSAQLDYAYNQYRRVTTTTARGEKLLLMLYDGLIIDLKQAKQAIEQKDPATAHTFLMKSQEIIAELMRTLRMEYEISGNLSKLYDYLLRRLAKANIRKDAAIVEEALQIVTGLRSAWAAAAAQVLAGGNHARQA
jgi:flagellar protein FliS